MVQVRLKLVTPRIKVRAFNRAIREGLIDTCLPIAEEHAQKRTQVVSDWDHQPIFKAKVVELPKRITFRVDIENATDSVRGNFTYQQLWQGIDRKGFKARKIVAKPGKVLMFPGSPYLSHTFPVAQYGGPGRHLDPTPIFRRSVRIPRIQPRHFSREFHQAILPKIEPAIKRGVQRGFARLG